MDLKPGDRVHVERELTDEYVQVRLTEMLLANDWNYVKKQDVVYCLRCHCGVSTKVDDAAGYSGDLAFILSVGWCRWCLSYVGVGVVFE